VADWLVFDAGNSRLKFGWWDGVRINRLSAVPWGSRWQEALAPAVGDEMAPGAVVIGGVSDPEILSVLGRIAKDRWGLEPLQVCTTVHACGVRNPYPEPAQLGVDRWAAVIAASWRAREQWHLVVDAGTAVTVDLVAPGGDFRGGAIFPGAGLLSDSLNQRTAGLPHLAPEFLPVPTQSTPDAIRAGIAHGLVGAILHLERSMLEEGGSVPCRWLTGGDAKLLAGHLPGDHQHAPGLVLEGLARIAEEAG